MSIGMYYTVPMVAIFYFLSTQHQISVTYYMFLYYFAGNLVFGLAIYIPVALFIDRPIYAYLNLERDTKDAVDHEDYKLKEYLDNFKVEAVDGLSLKSSKIDSVAPLE